MGLLNEWFQLISVSNLYDSQKSGKKNLSGPAEREIVTSEWQISNGSRFLGIPMYLMDVFSGKRLSVHWKKTDAKNYLKVFHLVEDSQTSWGSITLIYEPYEAVETQLNFTFWDCSHLEIWKKYSEWVARNQRQSVGLSFFLFFSLIYYYFFFFFFFFFFWFSQVRQCRVYAGRMLRW